MAGVPADFTVDALLSHETPRPRMDSNTERMPLPDRLLLPLPVPSSRGMGEAGTDVELPPPPRDIGVAHPAALGVAAAVCSASARQCSLG